MSVFEWNDSLSVGVQQIDEHNQHLLKLIHGLYKGLIEQSNMQRTKLEFSELSEYIVFHFACEEMWMNNAKYSIITGHQEQHKQLRLMFMDIYNHSDHGDISIATMLLSLMQFIITHIQKSDATYGHFVYDKLSEKLIVKRVSCNYMIRK